MLSHMFPKVCISKTWYQIRWQPYPIPSTTNFSSITWFCAQSLQASSSRPVATPVRAEHAEEGLGWFDSFDSSSTMSRAQHIWMSLTDLTGVFLSAFIFKPAGWSSVYGFGDRFEEVNRDSGVSQEHGSRVGRSRSAKKTTCSFIISKCMLFMFPQSAYVFLCFDKGVICYYPVSPHNEAAPSKAKPESSKRPCKKEILKESQRSHLWQGYDLKKLGIPREAWPSSESKGKCGYTVLCKNNNAALWLEFSMTSEWLRISLFKSRLAQLKGDPYSWVLEL